MKKRLWLAFFIVASLTACDSNDISTVQKSKIAGHENYLIEQAFNNRHGCAAVNWNVTKDDRKRTVVEYTCEYNFAVDYYKDAAITFSRKTIEAANQTVSNLNSQIKMAQAQLLATKQKVDELKGRSERDDFRINEASVDLKRDEDVLNKLTQNAAATMAEISREKDEKISKRQAKLQSFDSVSEKFQWVVLDGKPSLVYIGFVVKGKAGTSEFPANATLSPSTANLLIQQIYENTEKPSSVQQYFLIKIWELWARS